MKKVIAAVLAWAILASPAQAEVRIDPSPVVQLVCKDGSAGTAVHIGDGKYITAGHVVNDTPCKTPTGDATDVRLYDGDFATFTGPVLPTKAKVSCRGFKGGEEYLAVGYAFGYPQLTFEPLVASNFGVSAFQMFTGEVIPGMSGGAVYDQRGRVTGIVNMRWPARSIPLKNTEVC